MISWAIPSPAPSIASVSLPIVGRRLHASNPSSFAGFRPIPSPPPPISRLPSSPAGRNRLFQTRPRLSVADDGVGIPTSGAESPGLAEASEAVAEMLREFGASAEDSAAIASGSPKYAEMLVRSVRELDELGLWGSWNAGTGTEGVDIANLSFKRKVYHMAKSKGDGGVLPFLESLGVKLSSATLIARYVSSEKLPELINKVNFVKDILYPSSLNRELLARNARRMMMHLSIPMDEDIQVTLSFFEKMAARQGGLNMLGMGVTSFPYLVESFPKLLLQSVKYHFQPLVSFLEGVGLPKEGISFVLLSYPPIIFYDIENDIKPKVLALEKAGVKEKDIGTVLLKYPWILSTNIQENYEKIVAYFNGRKVPKSSLDLAIRSWPHILGRSTEKMQAIMDIFNELGINKKLLNPVITSSPQLLLRKPSELLEVITFMEEFGFDHKIIGRILHRCPEVFATSVDRTLRNKVNFLIDFGIARDRIPRVIRKYPELLLLDTNSTLLPRLSFLTGVGLSKREVCSMICRFSPLLGYSIEVVLRPKVDFLVTTMQKPLKEIVEYPRYFSYSLDKKIKPRFWILKNRNAEYTLKDMLAKNDEDFAQECMCFGRLLIPP